jgi:hypothetical protein
LDNKLNILQESHGYCLQLRQELSRWLSHSIQVDGPSRHGGGEDEANYSLSWFPHYLVTGEEAIERRFRSLLEDLKNWVETECTHGYERTAEAHHGTEPFLLFLPRFQAMFNDDVAGALLVDAAHHIGNWIEGIPEWFDYENNRFLSYHLGTEFVSDESAYRYELAEHYRFISIALSAYRLTREQKYLDWSLNYGRRRARQILDAGDLPIPVLWDINGKGIQSKDLKERPQNTMAASNHHVESDPLAGIENLLASGAIYVLADLYELSNDAIFQQAALRIVQPLVEEILDPYADPGAAAVSYYRWAFKEDSLDESIRNVIRRYPDESDKPRAMVFPQEYKRREPGVGKRNDMILWGHCIDNGSILPTNQPSTAALTLAYQMTGNVEYACRAFKDASIKLSMARRVLRGGREHADMGGAICSVAAGHGRNWGQGAVTGCYGPLLLGTREVQNKVTPCIEVRDENGNQRLPENLVSLVVPSVILEGQVTFYNGGEDLIPFSWKQAESGEEANVTLAARESRTFKLS